jgi:ATP-dependent Lhr-like helicase
VAAWFGAALGEPTRAQALGWPPIARGESVLLLAPTGSGKTLAAFLVAIDRLLRHPAPPRARAHAPGPRVVYVSPHKALAVDVDRNLARPLAGIAEHAARMDMALVVPRVDVRTGDTSAKERARIRRSPGDVLITTPESLYLMLTSAARELLAGVETLIVDEIHALVPGKRGAHFAVSVERLEALRPAHATPLQRIGLSATQKPLDEVARMLGGFEQGRPRPITIVDAGARKKLDLTVEDVSDVETPRESEDEAPEPDGTIWPKVHARLVELVRAHRSTIIFVNSRRLAERLAAAVNDAAGEDLALAHHGSLAREKRTAMEERLKRGELRAIVATSSLELGIDMGAVDLVVQIEAPPSVASGLQRIGRASHGVGGVPRGVLLPKHRHDLLACAAAAAGMRAGDVEETFYPKNPIDVLAQHVVAIVAMGAIGEDELYALVRRAAHFAELPRTAFDGVLDMLSGHYPSDDFAELRARVTWDRNEKRLEPRAGAHRLAVTNSGTIPDRGLYGVFTAGGDGADPKSANGASGGRRVGELDEEMVFELRIGEVFMLGASSWRAEQITYDRVVVSPAAGEPGKMPFWHGDRPGRSRAFGARIGALVRGVADGTIAAPVLRAEHALAAPAAAAVARYVGEQVAATGEVPSDRAIVIERFVDELGDYRVVVLSPFGTRILAPWALVVAARLRERYVEVDIHYTDDGMAFRIPACGEAPAEELFLPPHDTLEAAVAEVLPGSALFAARFRECAQRALLLPRRDPRRRTPLWAQRKRAADLLAVASRHPTFPIVLETYRECLRDAFDVPGLVALLRDVDERRVRVTTVDRRAPSPFAASVLFAFVANFIYEGDAPPAERRAQALTIDYARLRELLGETELRELLDPAAIEEHEEWLQRLTRPATSADGVHDMLRAIGDLSHAELLARVAPPSSAGDFLRDLVRHERAVPVRIAKQERFVAVEDAAKVRDALGAPLPDGLPAALLAARADPVREIVVRYARTHGPFTPRAVEERFGLSQAASHRAIEVLVLGGQLVRGAFLRGGTGDELCHAEVLDAIRRKSLAKLRRAVQPVDDRALARFLVEWHGIPAKRRGRDGLAAVVAELAGCPLVASSLETEILPARLAGYQPADLDALCASGQVVWAGLEPLGAADGRIALYPAEQEALLARPIAPVPGPLAERLREALARRGAVFFADLARDVGGFPADTLTTLWQMVWAGEITNDTLEPLRSRARALRAAAREARGRARRPERPRVGFFGTVPRVGPPGSEGRWSLRTSQSPGAASATDRSAALARALLARYGVVTREAAHAEGVAGGFAAVYDVFRALEDQGRVRRGYFVEGRGGAQFALPGADERLRSLRSEREDQPPVVLAATDPASAWGAVVPWPGGLDPAEPSPERDATRSPKRAEVATPLKRAAGALVVLRDGALLGWLGRGTHPLRTFLPGESPAREAAARALAVALGALANGAQRRALLIATIDGAAAAKSPLAPFFEEAGFERSSRGLLKRAPPPAPASPLWPPGGGLARAPLR